VAPRPLIEDLALIGDLHTAALVSRQGAIEWLCLPHFDSPACFASLLGDERNGCWELAPAEPAVAISRRYRDETLVLETTVETESGAVRVLDFMPRRILNPVVMRIVEGLRGSVRMRTKIVHRFEYGSLPAWVQHNGDAMTFTVGENATVLRSSVELHIDGPDALGEFAVAAGESATFVLQWYPSYEDPPAALDPRRTLDETEDLWRQWARRCQYAGPYRDAVVRSLITLKALTYEPSGGCVAAPTTSLPERLGGDRNWDYRYAWIRDSALTIEALIVGGYDEEARAWRDWLLRVLAGAPEQLQIMYTITGGQRMEEYTLDHLSGYEGARPVRIGNAAYRQFQLGMYGHLMDGAAMARAAGIEIDEAAWQMLVKLLEFVNEHWRDPDHGIWELRRRPRCYTGSAVMAWVAFDRAIAVAQASRRDCPIDRWRATRRSIADEICRRGFSKRRNAFVQSYGSKKLDASLLLIPLVGFLPAGDERVAGTLAAIERELLFDGLLLRSSRSIARDGQPNEGAFLACNFWLVQNYAKLGRIEEARALFERVLSLANDVGLLSEEYDVVAQRLVGNFPQTFSHAVLVNTAVLLEK
jgi:GH15 family glucan-1,4-alpha-glucosidase